MKTKSAKAKGRRVAQAVADLLMLYAQDLKQGDIVVTPSGVTGPDLYLSPKARETYPYVVECKNQEKLNIWDALSQAQSHLGPDDLNKLFPVLFFSRNRSDLYVALRAEDLMKLTR